MAKISAHGSELAKVHKIVQGEYGPVTYVDILCSDGTLLRKWGTLQGTAPYQRMEYRPYTKRGKVKTDLGTRDAWLAHKTAGGWTEGDAPTGIAPRPRTWHAPNEVTEEYRRAIQACFPGWKGRKIRTSNCPPSTLHSYWDGGSRDYFAFFNTRTGEVLSVHSNHPWYEANQPCGLRELPPHILLIEHSILQGKDIGMTVYAVPSTDGTPVFEGAAAMPALGA